METGFEQHAALLQEKMPDVYEQLMSLQADPESVRTVAAKKVDAWNLERNIEGRWVSLYSKFNPYEETEKWVESIESNPKHIVLFGFGLGYHFEALARRFPEASFHVVEPDPQAFQAYIGKIGATPSFLNRIGDFLLSNQTDEFVKFFQRIIQRVDDSWLFLSPPKTERVYSEIHRLYLQAFTKVKESFSEAVYSLHAFEKIWNFNALENLQEVLRSPSIFEFKDQFAGKTVIMTASGPSLNEAIPLLRQMQETHQAVIVAAGTSVNALVHKGIRPDLFVSYDPGINNYKSLLGILDQTIPFVFGSTVHPKLPQQYKGPKAHMITSPDQLAGYFHLHGEAGEIVQDGPTITAVTLDLLNKLGVRKVYMVGQDLCFVDQKAGAEGAYHYNASGNIREDKDKVEIDFVENNNGETVMTKRSFLAMKKYLEQYIEETDLDLSIYNLSLHGAKVNGMPYLSLEKAEEELSSLQPVNMNLSFERKGSELETVIEPFEKDLAFFKDAQKSLERQYERFLSAPRQQKEKWQTKIDQTLDRITGHRSYPKMIYPLVMNRIHYMVRMKGNLEFQSLEEVESYFEKGVQPLSSELDFCIQQYKRILEDLRSSEGKANEHVPR